MTEETRHVGYQQETNPVSAKSQFRSPISFRLVLKAVSLVHMQVQDGVRDFPTQQGHLAELLAGHQIIDQVQSCKIFPMIGNKPLINRVEEASRPFSFVHTNVQPSISPFQEFIPSLGAGFGTLPRIFLCDDEFLEYEGNVKAFLRNR